MGVSFIGAGPGDAGLITVKGKRLIEDADTVIYPGSSINPEILEFSDGRKINSWDLSFEEVIGGVSVSACARRTRDSRRGRSWRFVTLRGRCIAWDRTYKGSGVDRHTSCRRAVAG